MGCTGTGGGGCGGVRARGARTIARARARGPREAPCVTAQRGGARSAATRLVTGREALSSTRKSTTHGWYVEPHAGVGVPRRVGHFCREKCGAAIGVGSGPSRRAGAGGEGAGPVKLCKKARVEDQAPEQSGAQPARGASCATEPGVAGETCPLPCERKNFRQTSTARPLLTTTTIGANESRRKYRYWR